MNAMKTKTLLVLVFFLAAMRLATAQTATPAKTTDYAAQGAHIVQMLAAGQYGAVEASFDAEMAEDLPEAQLSAQWKELLAQAGPFVKVKTTAVTPEVGGYYVVVMTCVFQRALGNDALVTFDKNGRIVGFYFGPQPTEVIDQWTAPSYVVVNRFHEVPVTVEDGPWHLPGTLTLPKGSGPFPAVVLVPGSPPLDQDSTLGPNKIFKDLAWGLASRGIAVLRYTKRTRQFGAGLGGGPLSSFTLWEELSDDARAAVSLLAGRSDVDHRQIYLLGHSMGGVAVPQIAAADSKIAGIVVMGTPAGDLLTAVLKQIEDAASRGGDEGKQASGMIPVFTKLRDGGFAPGEVVHAFGARTSAGYWIDLRNYEPGVATAKLKIPVMILVAGHDTAVPPDDFQSWKDALAGHKNATLKFYPSLFHMFMPSKATQRGDTPEDWMRPSHVTPEVIDNVASWILSKGKE
jgi:dienelactone hydrolase